ncbi:MAG TPA: diacylglycerol kinase [Rhizobiaceae bacterium]|nr:diacylglycerol kinase [Rhizobiaceae bacterium]
MRRLMMAAANSLRALRFLTANEAAFRLELILLVLALPAAYVLSATWRGFTLLIASIFVVMIVEALNTAVEAACNAITRETNLDIKIAKDCGSLAVAMAALMAIGLWVVALGEWLSGSPF